jgi:four helix bundle protein
MSSTRIKSFRDLDVWQLGMLQARDVYFLTRKLPREELYGLTSQIRRAATSVPLTLAEGHARQYTTEFLRYACMARGSNAEVETLLELLVMVELLEREETAAVSEQCDQLGRMLTGLTASLRARASREARR